MFRVTKIKIFKDSKGIKNLKDQEYVFLTEECLNLPENFYAPNIMVSAIVGKNGSGKTTVLEIIYRVLNNLCAILCTNLNTKDDPAFYYLKGLKAEIEFKDRQDNTCHIGCYDDCLWVDYVDDNGQRHKYCFGNGQYLDQSYTKLKSLTAQQRTDILNHLFYCSIVNYAPFTLNSTEYEEDKCVKVENDLTPEESSIETHNWMQAIFHKNDGYESNITISPFREKGVFDATKESKLVRERLLGLLILNPKMIEGYRFVNAQFKINKLRFADKFSDTRQSKENNYKPKKSMDHLIYEFQNIIEQYNKGHHDSVAGRILKALGYCPGTLHDNDDRYLYSYLYLVYKVLNSLKYPIFEKHKKKIQNYFGTEEDFNYPDLAFDLVDDSKLLNIITNLAHQVIGDHSHITFKIDRTNQHISCIDKLQNDDHVVAYHFSWNDYKRIADIKIERENHLIPIMRALPPSFFDLDIILEKIDKNGEPSKSIDDTNKDTRISFEQLSSGERQFYVTISSIIYHAMNIISISDNQDRVKYGNMLVVLDESEICFHPEYQRTFIYRLIEVIKRLKFNSVMNFHLLLTTHSPFILSDIPSSNILYLKDGKSLEDEKDDFVNPLGANINDILCQSFFLDKEGFIGKHVRNAIISLYSYLTPQSQKEEGEEDTSNLMEDPKHNAYKDVESEIKWNDKSALTIINTIGEPLIKESLLYLYQIYPRQSDNDKIDQLRKQIAEMEAEIAILQSKDDPHTHH